MLFIYIIHAFQATATPEDFITGCIYMFATMSGAAIFIFVMGIGTVYSRYATPKEFVKSGIRMIIYQYLNNLLYVAAPFLCRIPVNVPVIGYLMKLLIGEADFVSFTPLYFLSYALLGVALTKF